MIVHSKRRYCKDNVVLFFFNTPSEQLHYVCQDYYICLVGANGQCRASSRIHKGTLLCHRNNCVQRNRQLWNPGSGIDYCITQWLFCACMSIHLLAVFLSVICLAISVITRQETLSLEVPFFIGDAVIKSKRDLESVTASNHHFTPTVLENATYTVTYTLVVTAIWQGKTFRATLPITIFQSEHYRDLIKTVRYTSFFSTTLHIFLLSILCKISYSQRPLDFTPTMTLSAVNPEIVATCFFDDYAFIFAATFSKLGYEFSYGLSKLVGFNMRNYQHFSRQSKCCQQFLRHFSTKEPYVLL